MTLQRFYSFHVQTQILSIYINSAKKNRRMGCGVAMTVLQTRELINVENNIKATKTNLKTTNQITKANISLPSVSVIKVNSSEAQNIRESPKPIQKEPKPALIPSQPIKQDNLAQEKKEDKIEHLQKIQQPLKQGKQNLTQSIQKEKAKVQKSPKISINKEAQRTKVVQQKNAVISDKPNIKHQTSNKQKSLQPSSAKEQIHGKDASLALTIKIEQKDISPKAKEKTPSKQQIKSSLPLPKIVQESIKAEEVQLQSQKITEDKAQGKNQNITLKEAPPQIKQQSTTAPQDLKTTTENEEKKQMKPAQSKTQFIQIQSIKRNTPPSNNSSRPIISSKQNLHRKESSANLSKDLSRKSLKVKKGMVPVDSLFLQSVITKPEESELQKQNSSPPQQKIKVREQVSINIPKGRKSKNEPIKIVQDLKSIDRDLQKTKIASFKSKVSSTKKEVTPNVTEENIARITQQRKKVDDEKRNEQNKKKAEQQRRKQEEFKKIQEVKRKLQQQEKKNIERQANKLKKVYNV